MKDVSLKRIILQSIRLLLQFSHGTFPFRYVRVQKQESDFTHSVLISLLRPDSALKQLKA